MRTKVVGVTFSNEDGSSRSAIIARMTESDKICLERDPFNEYDSNAVKVCVIKGEEKKQIGFLSKDLASDISPKIRRGTTYKASVVECGMWNDRPYCEIEIEEVVETVLKQSPERRPVPRPNTPTQHLDLNQNTSEQSKPSITSNSTFSSPDCLNYNKKKNSGCMGGFVLAILVIIFLSTL